MPNAVLRTCLDRGIQPMHESDVTHIGVDPLSAPLKIAFAIRLLSPQGFKEPSHFLVDVCLEQRHHAIDVPLHERFVRKSDVAWQRAGCWFHAFEWKSFCFPMQPN